MIATRTRTSDNILKRQRQRTLHDVTTTGADIPLPHEKWATRWCTLTLDGDKYLKELYDFEVKDDDVFVVTFPKCGTTWIQEATWLLMNNLDYDTANQVDLPRRSIFMELSALYPKMPRNTLELSRNAASPRLLKSHFPAHLLPRQIWREKSKIVYCTRNPKDTAVSYFHFHRGLGTWEGSIDDFVEDLINNDIIYSPYWENLMDFWQMRHEDNVFFTTYEDMKRDLRSVLVELNRFLEKPQLKEEDLQKLEQHLSFDNMKANCHTNLTLSIKTNQASPHVRSDFQFMRRGIVGSFKDELSQETQAKLEEWTELNLSKYNVKLEDIFGEL